MTSRQLLPSGPGEAELLKIFVLFWLLSLPLDLLWLLGAGDAAALSAVVLVGANMCLKLVSVVACSTALLHLGVLDGAGAAAGGGGMGGAGSLNLGRSGNGSGGGVLDRFGGMAGGGYTAPPRSGRGRGGPQTAPGSYRDDEVREQEEGLMEASEEDAQPVTNTTLFDSATASAPPAAQGKKGGAKSGRSPAPVNDDDDDLPPREDEPQKKGPYSLE